MNRILGTLRATKGWRTLAASLAISVAGVLQSTDWTTLVPEDRIGPVMVGIGVLMAVLRVVTDGPVGGKGGDRHGRAPSSYSGRVHTAGGNESVMFRNLAPAAVFAAALAAAGGLAPDAALAAGCLSSKEARSAVQNGQAVSLSKMVKRIEKATGGQILPTPELCKNGGRLTYTVNVLKPDGSIETLTVDAASGNIAGY